MTVEAGRQIPNRLLIDTHVHIHRCFDLNTFFSAVRSNLQAAANSLGLPPSTPGCLMLAETAGEDAFTRAGEWLSAGGEGEWTLQSTGESISLAAHSGGRRVVVVAGRQVVTREGLEVLGLATDRELPFDLSVEETIRATYESGAIPVVPWGFGKWWFSRGKLLSKLLNTPPAPALFLGDNFGRPAAARSPRHFALAAERGISVLPGTDPLPIPSHVSLAGRYGMVLDNLPATLGVGSAVKSVLSRSDQPSDFFGHRVGLPFFLRSQIGIRFFKSRNAGG